MPCWDSLLYTKASTPYGNAKPQEESPEIKHLESIIHKLTEMLCELCSRVEAGWPSVFVENTELSAWWKSHKADDRYSKAMTTAPSRSAAHRLQRGRHWLLGLVRCLFRCRDYWSITAINGFGSPSEEVCISCGEYRHRIHDHRIMGREEWKTGRHPQSK